MRRHSLLVMISAIVFACALDAEAQTFAISIGIRETGSTAPIGSDGGISGSLEWVNLDGQALTLDGGWQTFTFNFRSDPLTPWAGTTANGMYDFDRGTLEHIRIRNSSGIMAPVTLWIDYIVNTTPNGTFVVSDFEGFGNGLEVTFQEPRFSGATAQFLAPELNTALTSDAMAIQGTHSNEVNFRFAVSTPESWLRLTTFNANNAPNPTIEFTEGSSLTFQMKGLIIPEPASATTVAPALLTVLLKRRRGYKRRFRLRGR